MNKPVEQMPMDELFLMTGQSMLEICKRLQGHKPFLCQKTQEAALLMKEVLLSLQSEVAV